MVNVETLLNSPRVKAFGIVVTIAIGVVAVAIVVDKYYTAKKTRQDYKLNQYKLHEAKEKFPDLKISGF